MLKDEFDAAMDDDLNTSRALAALFEAVRAGNRALDAGERSTAGFVSVWGRLTDVLQVLPTEVKVALSGGTIRSIGIVRSAVLTFDWDETPPPAPDSQSEWAKYWAAKRAAAKQSRDFTESDRIRALLDQHGWEVRDNRDGTATVQRK